MNRPGDRLTGRDLQDELERLRREHRMGNAVTPEERAAVTPARPYWKPQP